MTIALSNLATLALGLFALVAATAIAHRVPVLARLSVPTPVIGGMLAAIVIALLQRYADISIQFANQLTGIRFMVCSSAAFRSSAGPVPPRPGPQEAQAMGL